MSPTPRRTSPAKGSRAGTGDTASRRAPRSRADGSWKVEARVAPRPDTVNDDPGTALTTLYNTYTFDDGSTFVTKMQGTTTAEGKIALFKGRTSFVQGSGRFAGIQGEGSYTGKRFAPLPGAGAELYWDQTATYAVPR